jgi:hypothetical protein
MILTAKIAELHRVYEERGKKPFVYFVPFVVKILYGEINDT